MLDATTAGEVRQPAKSSTIAYRDHLSQLWLLDPLPGWTTASNGFSRLGQSPKHQLADPALAARLLNLSAESLLGSPGSPMAGPLFESLVALGIRVMAQVLEARVSHFRLTGGDREVDLIVEGPDVRSLASKSNWLRR